MKTLRWAALLIFVVVVVATVAHIRRDSIARGIANSIFDEQDIVVTELSVDHLSARQLQLSKLLIESESGARYRIFGLSIPLRTSDSAIALISADRLVVQYAEARDTRALLSASLQTVLDLPRIRPNLEVTVAQVSLPGFPELTDVIWVTRDQKQALSFVLENIEVAVGIERQQDQRPLMNIHANRTDGDDSEVLSAALELSYDDASYAASGPTMIRLAAWAPILQTLGLLPASLEGLDAQLQGPAHVALDQPQAGHAAFDAQLVLSGDLTATYRRSDGQATDVLISAVDQLEIGSQYPSFDWTAHAARVQAIVDTDDIEDLPVVINDLECRKGIRCALAVAVKTDNRLWNGYDIEETDLTLPMELELNELTRIDVSAGARGSFKGIRTSDFSAASIDIVSFSGTQLVIDDDAWRCQIDELELLVTEFAGVAELVASIPVTFSNLAISDSARTVETRVSVAAGAKGSWDGMAVYLPGVVGSLALSEQQLTASLLLDDRYGALSASGRLEHDLAHDTGSLKVSDAQLLFDHAALSDLLPGWPYPLDIVDGTWEAQAQFNWRTTGAMLEFDGEVTQTLDALAGRYNDIAFVGLRTAVDASLGTAKGLTVKPSRLDLRLLDVGLPLEHIAADYSLDISNNSVLVSNLTMAALGGALTADSFQFSPAAEVNVVPMRADSIQLQLMVDIAEFENIEMTGAISGELPVIMHGSDMTIEGGRLESDSPGGVIRYHSGDGTLAAVAPDNQLSIVARALSNFEFDSLTSDVDYNESGDLALRMRLSGINPDMDATQPIVLNLNVENNVPQLLRSLRAVRSIEDILEQQTAKQTN